MAEIGAGDITYCIALMQHGLLAQNHMLRMVEHQTNQTFGQCIRICLVESLSAFESSTFADRKGEPRLMRVVLTVHIRSVTAISFFETHGVECPTTGCYQSIFFSCLPQRIP